MLFAVAVALLIILSHNVIFSEAECHSYADLQLVYHRNVKPFFCISNIFAQKH